MPVLHNARHEKFARAVAKGKPQYKAYIAAGYQPSKVETAWSSSSHLASTRKVEQRVSELKEEAAKRHEVTVDYLIEKCHEAFAEAKKLGQSATLVAAIKEMGVLSGKRVERAERDQAGAFAKLEDMSQEELVALVRQVMPAGEPANDDDTSDQAKTG